MAINGTPSHSYWRHLPYGITQCYLPPDRSEHSYLLNISDLIELWPKVAA